MAIAINVLVGVLTGVITGVVVGYLGFRYALRQFRTQRAFDRQLEWYETTIRAILRMRRLFDRLATAFKEGSKTIPIANNEVDNAVHQYLHSTDESIMFAKNRVYTKLISSYQRIAENNERIGVLLAENKRDASLSKEYAARVKELGNIALDLAKDVRGLLELDDLTRDELETGNRRTERVL